MPADILILAVSADDDRVVNDRLAARVLDGTPQVPDENKQAIMHFTDNLGQPTLLADHFACTSLDLLIGEGGGGIFLGDNLFAANAVDYYGYWKWFDGLTDTGFFGTNKEYALGDTDEQTFMGLWSDGTPVIPAEVYEP
jgi:hypothetical protein